jgi:hypothetical protein
MLDNYLKECKLLGSLLGEKTHYKNIIFSCDECYGVYLLEAIDRMLFTVICAEELDEFEEEYEFVKFHLQGTVNYPVFVHKSYHQFPNFEQEVLTLKFNHLIERGCL